jgi:hydroxymethylglutaryl-CoA synthase
MKGIISYGIYLPYYRLKRETIFKAMSWFNPGTAGLIKGEKAVASCDEDSITLSVAAGMDCFTDIDRNKINALYLASTTFPNMERANSSIAGMALNLPSNLRGADFSGSLKSGTTALISALNNADSEVGMVCASDCRLSRAGGNMEQLIGDGAAAMVVGSENIIASFLGSYSISCDFADHRRMDSDKYISSWEERWIREEGYTKIIPEVVHGLLSTYNLAITDISKMIYPPISVKDHKSLSKQLGIDYKNVQSPLIETVGNTGAAHPLLMLAAALDEAKPGDKIVVVSMGSGSDALLFEVTEKITKLKHRNKLKKNLEYKAELETYTQYLSFKGMIEKEIGIRGEEVSPTSQSLLWRERNAIIKLVGSKCNICNTPQFPKESVCIHPECGAVEQMEDYCFSDKIAKLFTYTADHLTFTENPPGLYGIVDFEGGGRYWFDITDCRMEDLSVGQPVQMTFRRRYLDKARSLSGYFWKAMPLKE